MPVYVYEHTDKPPKGCRKEFELYQEFGSKHLKKCPVCKGKVQRIIVSANFSIDRLAHTELQQKGFTKLVRRDKGTYEIEGAAKNMKKD
jgi:hypothetical protein